ncbi:MAG: metallophosphoesterase family protein [Longimicrobiales bacterium]
MRIGVISDTHGKLRPEVFTHFAGVDRILHAGDIGDADILVELEAIAPVTAVFGNVDDIEIRSRLPEVATLEEEGRTFVVVHGHQVGSPTPRLLRRAHPEADVVVFGHTHVPLIEEHDGCLFVNPGAAGPARFRLKPSVAVLELVVDGMRARLIQL